ncbi:MAG TPA: T9SS type A sorting domain-containing protein [Bacteroidales bacterium]|nr:T9SS type A sorting domain-containing protein [Bacteroidales bacterium]
MKRFTIISIVIFAGLFAHAQEKLTGLQYNPLVEQQSDLPSLKNLSVRSTYLTLPFIEHFNSNQYVPDAEKWADRHVFINKDFPIDPPSAGAATFDVLDQHGKVYQHAVSVPFIADYLTSRRIRLDSVFAPQPRSIGPADSLYFSFYYQPQGRGDSPEPTDSLVLEFGYPTGRVILDYIDSITIPADLILIAQGIDFIRPLDTVWSPSGCTPGMYMISNRNYTWGDDITLPCDSVFTDEIAWEHIWSTRGMTLQEFETLYQTKFRQVLIPVTDSKFFTDDFRFRFYNWASIADAVNPGNRSNVDQWNIDLIYLNVQRGYQDIYHRYAGFSGRAPSFLRRFEAMPYRQYRASPTTAVRPGFTLNITNLSDEVINTTYHYNVNQTVGDQEFSWNGGICSLPPFHTNGFQQCNTCQQACPVVSSLFKLDFGIDTTSFRIVHKLRGTGDASDLGDSLVYLQGFYNYFAYDDGTPEIGYSLEPAGAYLAYQFQLNTPDTLTGVQILFNRTLNEGNNRLFDLIVWRDQAGQPGQIAYRKVRLRPQWSDLHNGFHLYTIDQPVLLSGNFYVGLMQEETGSLNIGLDRVNNSRPFLFINTDGVWRNSQVDGALMIRPVFGKPYLVGQTQLEVNNAIRIWPNPAGSFVNIELSSTYDDNTLIRIADYTGRCVFEGPFSNQLDISRLKPGIYILSIIGTGQGISTARLVIQR